MQGEVELGFIGSESRKWNTYILSVEQEDAPQWLHTLLLGHPSEYQLVGGISLQM